MVNQTNLMDAIEEIRTAPALKIDVMYHCEAATDIKQAHPGEWFDLRAAKDYHLMPGDFEMIDLGVSIALPHGYEAIIAPRSSTFKKYGVIQTNGIGVIDETYCGDTDIWKMPVLCVRESEIKAGDRICQFRIQPNQGQVPVAVVDTLGHPGRGGFGSTGTK